MYSEPIREALERVGIQCSDPATVQRVLAQPANRRFLAFLKLCANTADSVAWATLIHLEGGLNTDAFLDYLYERAAPMTQTIASALFDARDQDFPDAPGRTGPAATVLVDRVVEWLDSRDIPRERPDEGWCAWCQGVADSAPVDAPTSEFLKLLEEVEERCDERVALDRLLGQLYPLGRDIAAAKNDGVRIMTMMSSKGLTVRATIVAGLDNVVMPRPGADHGEARRLLYVAMTRSKEYLYVTWAKQRRGPSARAGGEVLTRRMPCEFLDSGPVATTSGERFLRERWS
jgi:superfamily I DNA/RNA helicase